MRIHQTRSFSHATIAVVIGLTCLRPALAFDGDKSPPPSTPADGQVRSIASSRVMLSYDVADAASGVTQVELWYTADRGKSWHSATGPAAPGEPIIFDAPDDGLYGFFIILHNQAGASAPPPSPGVVPQQWVRVDRAAPTVQAQSVRPDAKFARNRVIHLRWSAGDDNLPDRPVVLHYRTEETKSFKLIADSLPARGMLDWAVPDGVAGRLEIKISAADRAGNTGTYMAEPLRISAAAPTASAPAPNESLPTAAGPSKSAMPADDRPSRANSQIDLTAFRKAGYSEPDAGAESTSAASSEARAKYEAGTWHRLRGDYGLAQARYQEALELDPGLLAARCDLAGVLLLRGDAAAAQRELESVLTSDAAYRPALKGLALIQAKRRDYKSARETLDKVLLLAPRDAEAWLAFGDVMLFIGDRPAARRAWEKAAAWGQASDSKERAAKRLAMYPDTLVVDTNRQAGE